MGHAAVSALVSEINGTPASRTELKFHPELIVRGSTGAAPVAQTTPQASAVL
jgi:DNA-binding LacI/PurR family transcriptional regulator